MNATIEPRLIALLNDDHLEVSASLELPPLHRPSIFTADGRPLLIEPHAPPSKANLAPQNGATSTLPLDDGQRDRSEAKQVSDKPATDRALGSSSPQSLRKILDNGAGELGSASSKKRLIAENSKDDFVQLPQPPKKHKAAKQVVPPIIIGLLEPPPQTALFPPIASSSFHDSHGRNSLNTVTTAVKQVGSTSKNCSSKRVGENTAAAKTGKKRKDGRVRKKWSEDETNNLLLGVAKYGVGNWMSILEDNAFSFNGRSGADLKDRFRTCCPAELRDGSGSDKTTSQLYESFSSKNAPHARSKSSLMAENILIDDESLPGKTPADQSDSSKVRKSRVHRKKLEDLVQLGIAGPFRRSQRRERRPFTADEDNEILKGYKRHGPAWTKIQRDPEFHLQSRQPTDLRDRFRNKYPEKFRAEDKGDSSNNDNDQSMVQSSSTMQPREKDQETQDQNLDTTVSQPALPPLQTETATNERGQDGLGKENVSAVNTQPSSSLQSFSSREGLRIQEIISSEDDTSKSVALQPQNPLFGFRDNFGTFSDQPPMETSEVLPFSQSYDWSGSMTAPFTSNMGEMDISRLLLDEGWIETPNSNGKEKQNLTDINSIINSGPDPPSIPSFYNLLGDAEPIVDLHESPFN